MSTASSGRNGRGLTPLAVPVGPPGKDSLIFSPGAQAQARKNMLNEPHERIYSSQQLVQALRSALTAVRDQLQVLTILDSTALSWPGLNQAVDDLQFLVDMSSQTTSRLELDHANMETLVKDARSECITLKETLAMQNQSKEDLQRKVLDLEMEIRKLQDANAAAAKESAQQKQEIWTLEKHRADLAAEYERFKQDNEFMEGELSSMRSTVSEQMQQITTCKEELAGKRADCAHLTKITNEQKEQLEQLKSALDATSEQLHIAQSSESQLRVDKEHYAKEADRFQDEAARLGVELNKAMKELERLKEWQDVTKRVEADKLREEQEGRAKERQAAEQQRNSLEKAIAKLQADLSHRTERLQAKTTEAEGLSKNLALSAVLARDLQKEVSVISTEKTAIIKERDEAKAQAAKLQEAMQRASLAAASMANGHAVAENKLREAWAVERAKLVAQMEESKREGAVQKTLADGWARDLKEAQEALKEEQAKQAALQSKLETMLHEKEGSKYDGLRGAATAEQQVIHLTQMLEARERDLKRLHVEFNSEKMRLEKHIQDLQRECNESAAEIARLRSGEGVRLPPLGRSLTVQDELDSLKRMLNSMPQRMQPPPPQQLPSVSSVPKQHSAGPKAPSGTVASRTPPGSGSR